MNPYYLVTKEELYWIKNDCKYPLSASCDGCEYARPEETNPCTFIGANASIDEVLARPYNPQAEREKVLDELGVYLDVELERASQFNAMRNFALLEVKRKIKELRQSKDGE